MVIQPLLLAGDDLFFAHWLVKLARVLIEFPSMEQTFSEFRESEAWIGVTKHLEYHICREMNTGIWNHRVSARNVKLQNTINHCYVLTLTNRITSGFPHQVKYPITLQPDTSHYYLTRGFPKGVLVAGRTTIDVMSSCCWIDNKLDLNYLQRLLQDVIVKSVISRISVII